MTNSTVFGSLCVQAVAEMWKGAKCRARLLCATRIRHFLLGADLAFKSSGSGSNQGFCSRHFPSIFLVIFLNLTGLVSLPEIGLALPLLSWPDG